MFFERNNLLLSGLWDEELSMSNTYDLEKVDQSFEGSSRARESSKMREARKTVSSIITNTIVSPRRTVSSIITNTIVARVKIESFFV